MAITISKPHDLPDVPVPKHTDKALAGLAAGKVVLIKMVLIQHLYGIPSLRQTYQRIGLMSRK